METALNKASNQGWGRVMFPAGLTFYVSQGLRVRSGTVVQIDGTIKLKAGSTQSVIYNLDSPQGIVIEGCGVIDGGYAGNQTGNQLGAQGFTSAQGLLFSVGTDIHVRDITIQNTSNCGWSFGASKKCVVNNVTVTNQGNTSGFTSLTTKDANGNVVVLPSIDCWAQNCVFQTTRGDYAFGFYGAVQQSGITGCDISGAGSPAIGILSDSGQGGVSTDCVIADNILHDNPGGAIGIQSNANLPAGVQHSGIVVTGNRCFNNCQGASGVGVAGVYITAGKNIVVADNHFGPDGNSAYATTCIAVVGGAHSINTVIEGNLIVDQGVTAGKGNSGVFCDGGDTNTTIRGNVFADTRGTPAMDYAIFVQTPSGAGCVVEDNTAHGIATPWRIDPALIQVRQSGLRWNLDGPVSAPSLAVTGSTTVNGTLTATGTASIANLGVVGTATAAAVNAGALSCTGTASVANLGVMGTATAATVNANAFPCTGGSTLASLTVNGTDDLAAAWTQSTPSPSPTGGTFANARGTVRTKKLGRTVFFSVTANIVANGSGSGVVYIPLPYAAAANEAFGGRDFYNGRIIAGTISTGQTNLYLTLFDGSYPAVSGSVLVLSGTYEANA